jgi:NADH-quinone oxidoreductase subunit M
MSFPILSLMLLVPVAAAIACLFLGNAGARWLALGATLANLALGIFLWGAYEIGGPQWQFVEFAPVFGPFAWALGIDGIALMLIMLSVFLMPICIAASWSSIEHRIPEYMASFLLMETLMLGVFMAQDIFLFYLFFEAGLIPMYLIIGIWGGKERIYASYKFFLYTLLGSVLMLIAMLWMVNQAGTTFIPDLLVHDFPVEAQTWLWLAFLASSRSSCRCGRSTPGFPTRTSRRRPPARDPRRRLLKLGGYGFVRFSLPMFPEASAPALLARHGPVAGRDRLHLAGRAGAAGHEEADRLLVRRPYGLRDDRPLRLQPAGDRGALIVMLSHGLISGALFLCVGVIYDRLHTREIDRYGGLSNNMPAYALLFLLFTMASVGLPGTSGFVGEFLALVGAYEANSWVAFVATTGIILAAAYMLYLYWRVAYGTARTPEAAALPDLNKRELAMLGSIGAIVLWMGVYPESFLAPMRQDVGVLLARIDRASRRAMRTAKLWRARRACAPLHRQPRRTPSAGRTH